MRKLLLFPVAILGLAACNGGYADGPPARGYYTGPSGYYGGSSGYYGGRSAYYPPPRYSGGSRYADAYGYAGGRSGQCTFRTRRGPVPGYIPPGKDRCCIQTPEGQSCQ
jgi:hypothetical protein